MAVLPRPSKSATGVRAFFSALRTAGAVLDSWKPDVVFSKGAAVSVPLCLAAYRRGIPVVIHESDAVMGTANRLCAPFATAVCTGFDLQKKRFVHTGNPLRRGIQGGRKEDGLRITGLQGKRPVLLVIGGSQGAKALNTAIVQQIDALLQRCDIVHLTGAGKATDIVRKGYWQTEFADMNTLAHLYVLADVSLSRCGAGSMTELAACGVAPIFVPIRGLAHDHQYKNAIMAQERSSCSIVLQEELPHALLPTLDALLSDNAKQAEITANMASLFLPNAAERIADILRRSVASRG